MTIKPDPEKTAEIDAASEKLRDLLARRPPPSAETRRQAAAVVAASLASAVGGQSSSPPPPLPQSPSRVWPLKLSALLVGLWMAGCANPIDPALRRTMLTIEEKWPVIRRHSQPAEGVDQAEWDDAAKAMDHAVTSGGEAARAE
mgnify:CR=1 FL=1